jgi:hypothetical protein
MKLIGTLYSLLSLKEIAQSVCPAEGSVKCLDERQFQVSAKGMQLTLEQSGVADPLTEALLFGEIDLPLSTVEEWYEAFKADLVGGQIDLHADEARLVRRFIC